jgi:hypothetical protein
MNERIQPGILEKGDENNEGNREKVVRTPAPHENKISDKR